MNTFQINMHYADNPPQGEATHYNTVGGVRSEYLCQDGYWFYHNGHRWIYMPCEPTIKTPVGELEPLRVWYPKEVKKVQASNFNEGDYYSRFD